jgi:predicted enzyme related to lactoylglutathione lyase
LPDETVPAAAVLYVGDLTRMSAFYRGCFGLSVVDSASDSDTGYCGLSSADWLLTLVQSAEAQPTTMPAPRRTQTPIKLAFEVDSIEAVRSRAAGLGGQVDSRESGWSFRRSTHCDCIDPEGNVIQLIEPHRG